MSARTHQPAAEAAPTPATMLAAAPDLFQPRRRAAPGTETTSPPPQPRFAGSLAAVPAAPRAQRRCSACQAEESAKVRRQPESVREEDEDEDESELTGVQPSTEVGPAGDRYEREADSIAARVMAMPAPGGISASGAGAGVQRACAACAGGDDERRARRASEAGHDDDEDLARPAPDRNRNGNQAGPRLAASPERLTQGGRPLPAQTRSFFEPRLGRDLSGVRVHEGGESLSLNRSIRARAFTYGEHIWYGAGERPEPTFTTAHELAHVMQQTAPGPLGPAPGPGLGLGTGSAMARADAASPTARRVRARNLKAFWLPLGATGARGLHGTIHDRAVEAIGKKNPAIIREAPIPGANAGGVHPGRYGFADLFLASPANTVGVEVDTGHTSGSGTLPVKDFVRGTRRNWRGQQKGSGTYSHASNRAPQVSGGKIINLTNAPKSIRIGDMKPGHNESERDKGVKQIGNYIKGIRNVVSTVNTVPGAIDTATSGGAKSWSVNSALTMRMHKGDVTIPDGWDPHKKPTKAGQKIKLSYDGDHYVPWGTHGTVRPMPITGRWVIAWDKKHRGIWTYFMLPDQDQLEKALKRGTNKAKLRKYGRKLQNEVLDPLITTPSGKKARRRVAATMPDDAPPLVADARAAPATPGRPPAATPVPRATPAVRRVRAKGKEDTSFDYAKWNEKRVGKRGSTLSQQRSFEGRFEKALPEKERETIHFQAGAVEAIEEIKEHFDAPARKPSDAAELKRTGRQLDKIEFWLGTGGAVMGLLREHLGDVFVRAAELFQKVQKKVKKAFRKLSRSRGSTGGGLKKAALKVGFTVIKNVGSILLQQTADALMTCLEEGFQKTMKAFTEGTVVDDLKTKAEEAQAFVDKLKKQAMDKVDQLVDTIVGGYETQLKTFAEDAKVIGQLVSIGTKVVNAARIVGCLAGGLESAGIACVVAGGDFLLSLVGLSPTEAIAGAILTTCWAQGQMADLVTSIQFIRDIPKSLAQEIVTRVKAELPKEAQSLLCDPAQIKVDPPKPDDVPCEDFSGGGGGGGGGPAGGQGDAGTGGDGGGKRAAAGGGGEPGTPDPDAPLVEPANQGGGQARADAGGGGAEETEAGTEDTGARSSRVATNVRDAERPSGWTGETNRVHVFLTGGITKAGTYKIGDSYDVTLEVHISGYVFPGVTRKVVFKGFREQDLGGGPERVANFYFEDEVFFRGDIVGEPKGTYMDVTLPHGRDNIYPGQFK